MGDEVPNAERFLELAAQNAVRRAPEAQAPAGPELVAQVVRPRPGRKRRAK